MSDIRSGREKSVSVDPTLVYESLIDDISRTIVLELVVAIQGLSKVRSLQYKKSSNPIFFENAYTVCPRCSYPIYVVTYYIKWVITSWTDGII